jgi:hypothetical protein
MTNSTSDLALFTQGGLVVVIVVVVAVVVVVAETGAQVQPINGHVCEVVGVGQG